MIFVEIAYVFERSSFEMGLLHGYGQGDCHLRFGSTIWRGMDAKWRWVFCDKKGGTCGRMKVWKMGLE